MTGPLTRNDPWTCGAPERMFHAANDEKVWESPLGRKKGSQALGWVVD